MVTMWTNEQILKALGPKLAEELLWNIGHALMCDASGRRVAAQVLWRNACSIAQEGIDKLERGEVEP